MQLILLTTVLCTFSVLEARSAYRQYGPDDQPPDAATMVCAMAMHRLDSTCGTSLIESVFNPNMTPRQIYNKVLQTSLPELCSPFQQIYQCVTTQLAPCAGVSHPMFADVKQTIAVAGVALKFVCEQKVATIDRHKACLLREAGGQSQSIHSIPQVTLGFSIAISCAATDTFNPTQPFCVPQQVKTCAKPLIANQCGNEIATTLSDLAEQIAVAANCQTSLVRTLSESIRSAEYHVYKRLLDSISF